MTQTLDAIGELIESGKLDEARRAVDGFTETNDNRAELLFLRGWIKELSYDRRGAAATYERVLELEPDHTEANFRLALLADLVGDDEQAIAGYEQCTREQPASVNALINLAVLLEEHGRLAEAEACLKSVLSAFPEHPRARRFLKSVESCFTMVVDDRSQRDRERGSALLDVPISDFELSVRARNCLRQMNINTLGDLLKTTEAELLSYKNFGETSLNEIKALLTQKGLRLGQSLPVPEKPMRSVSLYPTGDGSQYLNKPVSELELSVRSRKCLQWLGIATLGELAMRSEVELMAIKNFGQTSLQEIKRQLALYGLSLR
ncbi:MAG: tetratricopeptide repeat protein [Planctomycetes bacterium]|nr:tetratricopeptide repeat protein [Planctomycetota bacterium]